MLKYIHGELYRIFRKKSLYIYLGAIAFLYALFVLIRQNGIVSASIVNDAEQLFTYLPVLVGCYLFAVLYCDDLRSNNLATLIGYGMKKSSIVLAKLVLSTILNVLIFALIPLFMFLIYIVVGHNPSTLMMAEVYSQALKAALLAIAYSTIAGIMVYGLQRGTFAVVLYVLLSLGIVSQLLMMILYWDVISAIAPNLGNYLLSNIVNNITVGVQSGSVEWLFVLEYTTYIVMACVLSIVAFHKKELEF
jgi:hypothetical protein